MCRFREELKVRVDAAASRFENWKRLLNETNTAESAAFKDENGKLKGEVSQVRIDGYCSLVLFVFELRRLVAL